MTIPDALASALASRYRIERELGFGGMATVWLAHDLKHDRDVALKLLRPELAVVLGGERFLREIRITARLQHPHILPLLDSGEAAGFLYYVMPYVEGESLRQRLEREGQLPLDEALALTRQIAAALDCAHRQEIVHRDIKPENILLSKGEAVVADFGIALAMRAAGGPRLTETGLSLGTPQYMSPEQAAGDREVDARSDVYSLGAVLYEMLCGEPPHTGPSTPVVIAKLLTQAPVPPRVTRAGVPEHVNGAVLKALAKAPADRFGTAPELVAALAAPSEAQGPGKSIVVLPFEDISPGRDNEYFADGLTEEVISALSRIRSLRVISRNSAMTLKGTRRTTSEIGELLRVSHVLEGSVRKAGNNLRITAQLIEAVTDAHLWTDRYDGTLDDVFDIQDKVARSIAEALQVQLGPAERARLVERPIADVRAHECYRRARHEMLFGTQEGFDRALRLVRQGIETLGEQPILQVASAQLHWQAVEWGLEPRAALMRTAVELTRRVEVSEPRHAPALLARLERFTGNQVTAIRHLEDAVEADPGDVDSLWMLSHAYSFHAGRPAHGRAVVNRLLSIDPLTVMNLWGSAMAFWMEGDFEQSVEVWEAMYRREPGLRIARAARIFPLARLGRIEDACREADALVAEDPGDAFATIGTAQKHALLRERDPLLALATGYLRDTFWDDPEYPEWVAGWLALVDERDLALEWLEHWVDRGSINYPMLASGDPFLERLRGETRFRRLLERVRPAWEQFVPRFRV
ncbi:MAG TPA: protein kinase [Longimicrobiales bacterium]|nr:protein kinase [Longimicrobiales bacterium]